jgi:hypothetical protein
VLQSIGRALVLRDHRAHLLEHARLERQHLPHHRVKPSADRALNAQFVAHPGSFGQQSFHLPAEKFGLQLFAVQFMSYGGYSWNTLAAVTSS